MDLKLPPLGEGVHSGSVVSILVKEGEELAKGQGMIEVETGKAVAPVPAQTAGKILKVIVSVGDKISVGQSILSIEPAGGGAPPTAAPKPAAAKAPSPVAKAKKPAAPPPSDEDPEAPSEEEEVSGPMPPASPTIRLITRELGIDLRRIHGSESGGRVVMADVRAYVQRLQRIAAAKTPAAIAAAAKPPMPSIDFSKWGSIAKRPMTPLRKVIAERMGQSWGAVPRVTQFEEADITALDALRKKYGEAFEKKDARLTLTVFVLKVVAETLKKHPTFNASIDEAAGELIFKEYYHIGMAVDTDQGLIVPVLRDVDKKDLVTLSKELSDLAARTRDRKVSMDELQGGTFTISNQGGIGGGFFTPIINLPEVAILGLGRGALKPVVRDGKIETRLLLPMALSYDHRVIDGGTAVRFMLDLAKGFETFDEKLCQT